MAETLPPQPLPNQPTLPVLPEGYTTPGMSTIPGVGPGQANTLPGIGPDVAPAYVTPGATPLAAPYGGITQSVLDMFF